MSEEKLNLAAETYVKLILAVGVHDPNYVDAYYGKPLWQKEAADKKRPLPALLNEAQRLIDQISAIKVSNADEMTALRHPYLLRQTQAVKAYIEILSGKKMSFDEEASALYDVTPPVNTTKTFSQILSKLKDLVSGAGSLVERYEHFKKQFYIPKDRVDTVFKAAVNESRARTQKHLALPEHETFKIEYVTNKPWSGYNWYKGNAYSVIQFNTDLPIGIERAVDLAAHEGYPGHHAYNSLVEHKLVREKNWIEHAVFPLYSPQSLIVEGTANFGIEVVFPDEERLCFERDILYPLAGIAPSLAKIYATVERLVDKLNYAHNEAARGYLNGKLNAEQTLEYLKNYALLPTNRARQRIKFIEAYRSYVINYNLGQDMVKAYILAKGGTNDRPEKRWDEFAKLLALPRLPSGLKTV